MRQPTLAARGPLQVFPGSPIFYRWLLDHPDQAVRIWRRLGARCVDIADRGGGRFGWSDGQGSDIHWDTVLDGPNLKVWYAQGAARPAPLLPAVPVRAVVVLHFAADEPVSGTPHIHQQADLYFQTDSKTAALAARLLGPSGPRMAEQCVSQLELFFSGLVYYSGVRERRASAVSPNAAHGASTTTDFPCPLPAS
jgi:hypothetical protein